MTPAGLYIHVPFCERKCRYCDFYSVVAADRKQAFGTAVATEIRRRRHLDLTLDSIYFGGGTPSLFSPAFYARLLDGLDQAFRLQDDVEITLEANPGTVDPAGLADYRRAGINRLNLGIQSFDDRHLSFLGRIHSGAQAQAAIRMARRAGFDNLGLDLIYGLPGQGIDDWRVDLRRALAHAPEHLSCYALTYEPGTPLTHDRQRGRHVPVGEDVLAVLFETTADFLSVEGFDHYEISNFAAIPQRRSRHNTKYWTLAPYLGFGPAAHSWLAPRRSWNVADLEAYIDKLDQGLLPEDGCENLDTSQQMTEAVFLGLRLAAGIDLTAFTRQFGTSLEACLGAVLPQLVADGFLRLTPERLTPTLKGMRFHDSISAMLTGVL
ncbi:MAG: radical SAM family heme chaperone HemW [Desulfosarcina sp.]|nr:radical SAM family heme chaperone HemW [Desulfobacterales bacterium]